jgi:hypothetical protein
MAAKLTRLTHKIAIQLHLVAESCTIFSSRSRWPVWILLDTPTYVLTVPNVTTVRNFECMLEKVEIVHRNRPLNRLSVYIS